jgi:adenine-specific DNA-methyltransferase
VRRRKKASSETYLLQAQLRATVLVHAELSLLERADLVRTEAAKAATAARKSELGQFLTPASVARRMASFLNPAFSEVRLLDPGAGSGILSAAAINRLCALPQIPRTITVTACEVDLKLQPYLEETLNLCKETCDYVGVQFRSEILGQDFIDFALESLSESLFDVLPVPRFNVAILNPPYFKLASESETNRKLERLQVKTSNIYSAFVELTAKLLDDGGELVAITPRSFCNGTYFTDFRRRLLNEVTLTRLHVFEARDKAFSGDDVLQETVILAGQKSLDEQAPEVLISHGIDADDEVPDVRRLPYERVVDPADVNRFIRLEATDLDAEIAELFRSFGSDLVGLGVSVSTGPVVDFRVAESLKAAPVGGSVPLIYPSHFREGEILWPSLNGKNPNALELNEATKPWLYPNGNYVLVKRLAPKEQRQRVVAALFEGSKFDTPLVGFENHLNLFHSHGNGLDYRLARGLCAYLNSTLVDAFFRQFNGHTQVNATDLRSLKYPSKEQLIDWGERIRNVASQDEIDELFESESMSKKKKSISPIKKTKKIAEALQILRGLGLPRAQQNERSALTLLSLLNIEPQDSWADAKNPLMGITPMMEFFAKHYGKRYKPNTRETVRRQTVHQFFEAGLIVMNPDEEKRPTNSPHSVYQIEPGALKLMRSFGTGSWSQDVQAYLQTTETLKSRYAQEREMKRIPVTISEAEIVQLSPGGQNVLVEQIVHEFAPRFTPGARVVYIGDTDEKFAHFDQNHLSSLGVSVNAHGKMPDVIVHYGSKDWLVLIEAVTSHGPINPKRREELRKIFSASSAGLVYVTAFLTRKVMVQYLSEISWETEVWVAESPTHLIHFNGSRFLGPYPE